SNVYLEDGTTVRGRVYNYSKGDTLSGNLEGTNFTFTIAGITDNKPNGQEGTSYGNGCIFINVDEYKDKIKFVPTDLAIDVENPKEVEEYLKNNYNDVY